MAVLLLFLGSRSHGTMGCASVSTHPTLCRPCLTQSPPQSLLAVGYTLTRLNHVLSRLQSDPEGLTRYVQALEARAAGPEANLAAQFAAVLARLRAAACAAA